MVDHAVAESESGSGKRIADHRFLSAIVTWHGGKDENEFKMAEGHEGHFGWGGMRSISVCKMSANIMTYYLKTF